jgi:predicted nuclease with RNAse H fold
MVPMTLIVGIDWATEKKNRAMVVLELTDGGRFSVREVRPSVDDDAVILACKERSHTVVAVDTPFGWPSEFSRFVSRWRPRAGEPAAPEPEQFRLRRTDRVVRDEAPKEPLSVAADRIAMGARLWASLVVKGGLWERIDVEGCLQADGPTIVEVYPGASALTLGKGRPAVADEASYKRDANTRRNLLRHIAPLVNVDIGGWEDDIVSRGGDSDETDAFLAAVTGAVYLSDLGNLGVCPRWRIRRPGPEELEAARTEGWIFFPYPISSV